MLIQRIESPDSAQLTALAVRLRDMSASLEHDNAWVGAQLDECGRRGVFEWFLPVDQAGQGWSEPDVIRGYLALSAACLTTTFVITQRTGACQRIAISENEDLKAELLTDLLTGASLATVGISHLTTSRRHLARPVLRAEETGSGFVLNGYSPWVTGAPFAQHVVLGATLDDGREILAALPTDLPGVSTPRPPALVGLNASQTGEVRLENVRLDRRYLLAGPVPNVMQTGAGARTGGLQTSTLAVGLASAAIEFLFREGQQRSDLVDPAEKLQSDCEACRADLLAAAEGSPSCTSDELRVRANSLALRSTQAALAAAKGAGYIAAHPAGRWCREALFFLVWSCPQPVLAANLCELAERGA
jgi:alkylation response protein AidB-like acyl-CoA dehydrogenase